MNKKTVLSIAVFLSMVFSVRAQSTNSVRVATRAPNNKTVTVYYRVPKNYDAKRRESYRVLVIFGGRNNDGAQNATGRLGWGAWADEQDVFLVCPGFKDDNYWEPQKWSGNALLEALARIGKSYKINQTQLLYYGYSAGSQCANLFPAWKPDLTRAWVSHACGYFHKPSPTMRGVPGLVTCGDADTAIYIISRRFIEAYRKLGIEIMWRSYPNHPHDVPPDSLALARAFLTHYHKKYADDLRFANLAGRAKEEKPVLVGDAEDYTLYPPNSPGAKSIPEDERVFLPSREVAEAWAGSR